MRYAFAGDRHISLVILKFLIEKGDKPLALLLSDISDETSKDEMIKISGLEEQFIFRGKEFRNNENIEVLTRLNLDYIIGIHFPFIIPSSVLKIPKIGFLNLHPAYLPYNKGWHTPSWAILENTPYGATLHFMTETLDEGDILHQKRIEVEPFDTAHSLYQKVLKLEEEVFFEAYEGILSLNPHSKKQQHQGTVHRRRDLKVLQEIKLNENLPVKDVVDKLRALTTNDIKEAAYFFKDGKKIAIQVNLKELEE